ncbi:MAG: Bestrophin, RFP-TM, chloride channel-domain-containing protein [Benniella sp.]|nr:MAG: Bestrophin, RFP-TM, chloride channel-domain-containing protein [Benniella sp.]
MPRKPGTTVFVRSKWPMMLRWKGTVIIRIWWQILLMGIYAVGVLMIHDYTAWKMNYSLSLVSVMGMVVSLLLVFRTNTAYDRYWEGRRLWSQMTLCIRNLTRSIWVCVAETETRDLLEKKSAINLLVAFAFATKHYLREEYGYNYDDMAGLLTHIPKYSIPISTQELDWRDDLPTPHNTVKRDGQVYHLSEATPQPNTEPKVKNRIRKQQVQKQALAYDFHTPTNIPVELSYYIASYIKSCSNKARVDASTLTVMNNALVSMMDCLTGFERILRTPIPLAYSIHLHHGTWIYLLSLPFQLVANLGPLMVPAVMLASFTLLGILGIGFEIENPFNDDYNDLPLDDFCKVIQAEVAEMVAHRAPVPSDWVFTDNNFPLTGIKRSAKELSAMTLEQVHELMKADHVIHHNIDYSRPVNGNNNGAQLIDDPEQAGNSSVVVDVPTGSEKKPAA